MKESEAKIKMCPKLAAGYLANSRAINVTHIDAQGNFTHEITCKGSNCMVWHEGVPDPEGNPTGKCGYRG